jgi:hypothetical protein
MGLSQFSLQFLQVTKFTRVPTLLRTAFYQYFLSLNTIVRVSEMCGSAPDDPCASTSC